MLTGQERIERHRQANYAWRKKRPEIHQAYKRKYYRKTAYALNHGVLWEPEEDAIILGHWPVPVMTDHELSGMLGRSVGAIQTRRSRLQATGQPEQMVAGMV